MILGKITIGDNVMIAAGSVVRSDVPGNTLVSGSPGVVVRTVRGDEIQEMIGY